MVDLGQTLTFSARIYDRDPSESGATLINPLTAALTIYRDGVSILTPTITVPPAQTGIFTYQYPAAVAGRYLGDWAFSFSGGNTAGYSEVFNVSPSDPGYLISLTEAKKHLNIPSTNYVHDGEILDWLAGVTPVIENIVGACIPRTVVEDHEASYVIRLDVTPVLSITSIVPYLTAGTTYSAAQVKVTSAGRLRLLSGLRFLNGPFEVTYVAGRRPVGANIRQAVKIALAHFWESQRGASGLPSQGPSDDYGNAFPNSYTYSIPNRALELLEADRLGPGVG